MGAADTCEPGNKCTAQNRYLPVEVVDLPVGMGLTMVMVIPNEQELESWALGNVNSIVDGGHMQLMRVNPTPFTIELATGYVGQISRKI